MGQIEVLNQFFGSNDILIVDSNSSARVSLTGTLVQLGAQRNRMSLVGTMEEARAEIARVKPKVIFCDFMVGKESGLDLIQDQKRRLAPKIDATLFALVTGNASQSAVARAAEEDVDTFVIKPYTTQTFTKCIADSLNAKLNPSEYLQLIETGKKEMAEGNVDDALKRFEAAKKMQDSPTLACFYSGQADQLKKALDDAAESYREGLAYNKIHYKCLVGLYELLMKQRKFEQAYEIVKKVAQYFPANPRRLTEVLRLAVLTNNYADIEGYYRVFTQLDNRTDELIRYICSALSITGKYYLSRSTRSRGLELFDKVASSCAGRIQYMKYAVETMVEYDCGKEAVDYLKRFPAELRGSPDYQISALFVATVNCQSGQVIKMARDLIGKGIEEASVYRVLISHSSKANLIDSAEDLVQKASKKWPEKAVEFAVALQYGQVKEAS